MYRRAGMGVLRVARSTGTPLDWDIVGRGSVAVRWLVNAVTFCDDHEVFFVAASGQIRLTVVTLAASCGQGEPAGIRHAQGEPRADLGSRGLLEAVWVEPSVEGGDCRVGGLATRPCGKL